MQEIIARYMDREIGINLDNPFKFRAARVLAVEAAHISVQGTGDSHIHHFPWSSIVQLIEDASGVEIHHLFQQADSFPLVIKVRHLQESATVL